MSESSPGNAFHAAAPPGADLPAGMAAEERVAYLYRALGFTVTRDVRTQGSQVDLVARQRIPGIGEVLIGVEVKDHPGGALPLQEVREFAVNSNLLIDGGSFHEVHLVTTGKITKASREAIVPFPRLRLRTYDELERELFNPEPALVRWLEQYRSKPINQRYVEIRATLLDYDSTDEVQARGRLPSSELRELAIANAATAVVLLADYGSGKTTTLERVKARSIEHHAVNSKQPVPVLIRLRDLPPGFDVEHVALDAVRSELGLSLPAATFWALVESGRLLFLLDGFDEITLRASEATRADLLARLSPLLFAPSPTILTSRPSYFASLDEYRSLLQTARTGRPTSAARSLREQRADALVAHLTDRYRDTGPKTPRDPNAITYRLDPLSSDQIDEFLQRFDAELATVTTTPADVREFLDSVYDLSDLIARPIILDMVVASVLAGEVNPAQKTLADGPSGLYEAYTRVQLERDWSNVENRRNLLPHEARIQFAEECALAMHQADALRIEPADLHRIAQRAVPSRANQDFEEILTDLRTCSFLTVDDRGGLEFIHRSYQEFFVARRIRHDLLGQSTSRLRQPLRWEYLYFLGSFGFTDERVYGRFVELARARTDPSDGDSPDAQVADNAAQATFIARDTAQRLTWSDRHITAVRRPHVTIIGSRLQDVNFADVDVDDFEIRDSELVVQATGNRLGRFAITNCTGSVSIAGNIGTLVCVNGKLLIRDSSNLQQIELDALDANIAVNANSPRHVQARSVTGRLALRTATVDIRRSDLLLETTSVITGSITDSVAQIPLATFHHFAATLTDSVLLVRGQQAKRSLSEATNRGQEVITTAGTDSLLLIDPSVPVDRWWQNQHGLISIGGHVDTVRLPDDWTGVFVRRTTTTTANETLQVHAAGPTALVIEGQGRMFEDAVRRLSDAIQTAHFRPSAAPAWMSTKLRPLLDPIATASETVDAIAQRIRTWSEAHADSLGPLHGL